MSAGLEPVPFRLLGIWDYGYGTAKDNLKNICPGTSRPFCPGRLLRLIFIHSHFLSGHDEKESKAAGIEPMNSLSLSYESTMTMILCRTYSIERLILTPLRLHCHLVIIFELLRVLVGLTNINLGFR